MDASQGDLRTSDPESQEVREDSRAVEAEALLRGSPLKTSESQSLERLRTGQHGFNRTPELSQAKCSETQIHLPLSGSLFPHCYI